jgi:hypothetical protein
VRGLSAVNVNEVTQALRDNVVPILAVLALLLGALCAYLLRRLQRTQQNLTRARTAAEEAARAAALAAPGGIDPEAVLEVLRRGAAPTLDNVYASMHRREQQAQEHQRAAAAAEAPVSLPG